MTISVRRLAAYLLLVLLPLQAFASAQVFSCAESMPHCQDMQMASADCCDHAHPGSDNAMSHGVSHDGHTEHDMSPCAGANACTPAATMAALSSVLLIATVPFKEGWHLRPPSFYLSFIPDGLHRPPNFLA